MISSRYQWRDIAGLFVIESFTRRVKWLVKQPKYAKYDTTAFLPDRVQDSFEASKTSRRLVMFQVWFSRSNAIETLQSYNQRLGRPRSELRDGIVAKTKWILKCSSWQQYLQELRVVIRDQDIPEMLQFAVFNSAQMRYHRPRDHRQICRMELPSVKVLGATGNMQPAYRPKHGIHPQRAASRCNGRLRENVGGKTPIDVNRVPMNAFRQKITVNRHGRRWGAIQSNPINRINPIYPNNTRRPLPLRPQNTENVRAVHPPISTQSQPAPSPISSSTNITNQRPRKLKPRHILNAPSIRPRAATAVPQRPTRPLSAPRSVASAHSAHSDPRRMPTVRTLPFSVKLCRSRPSPGGTPCIRPLSPTHFLEAVSRSLPSTTTALPAAAPPAPAPPPLPALSAPRSLPPPARPPALALNAQPPSTPFDAPNPCSNTPHSAPSLNR